MHDVITIQNVELPVVEIEGQRVVTLSMVDKVHQRSEGTARKRFNDHKPRFIETEDFFVRNTDEARQIGFTAPNGLILLTESGYLMLVKSFTDDLAWEVQRKLVNSYFRVKEAAKPDPIAVLNDPAAMRGLLLTYTERVIALEGRLEAAKPKIEALDRLSTSDGSLCITDAAKTLQVRPKDLFGWLQAHGWIYHRSGKAGYLAYQDRIQQGVLEHKITAVSRSDGTEKIVEAVRITPKGLTRLAQSLSANQSRAQGDNQ